MKCFNHHDRDAFGICKTCGKGLCLECIKEEEGNLYCKNNPACSSFLGGKVGKVEFWIFFVIVVLLMLRIG